MAPTLGRTTFLPVTLSGLLFLQPCLLTTSATEHQPSSIDQLRFRRSVPPSAASQLGPRGHGNAFGPVTNSLQRRTLDGVVPARQTAEWPPSKAPLPPSEKRPSSRTSLLTQYSGGFIENAGQWDSQVKFRLQRGNDIFWVTNTGIVFDAERTKPTTDGENEVLAGEGAVGPPTERERLVVTEALLDGDTTAQLHASDPEAGRYNYLTSPRRADWRTDVRSFSTVTYQDVWPGIDFILRSRPSGLEQEFIVRPGADADRVRVEYSGIERLKVDDDGSLVINTAFGELREAEPDVYEYTDGIRVPVSSAYKLTGATTYSFAIGEHTPDSTLVIDPLLYSTFIGSSAGYGCGPFSCGTNEAANAIAVDAFGNAYITGQSRATDFPTTPGVLEPTITDPNGAAFVTKLNPLGTALIYSTYLGMGSSVAGFGIAVDVFGNTYITGTYFGTFPTTANAFQTTCAGGSAFVAEINGTGDSLVYSTCFGGAIRPRGIAIDSNGKAYVVGATGAGLPITTGAFQPTFGGGDPSLTFGGDAFIAIFDTTTSQAASLIYSTYLGGLTVDEAAGVAVDANGMVYVTGQTNSSQFPTTVGAYQRSHTGTGPTGFVAKLNPVASGESSLIYSTYLGPVSTPSTLSDIPAAIAVDATGSAYVAGAAQSMTFPVTSGAFQTIRTNGAKGAAFVAKLSAGGSALIYSTLLQGSSGDGEFANGIAVDSSGNAYIAGTTNAANLPTTVGAFQRNYAGGGPIFFTGDAFVAKFGATGQDLLYLSYLGGFRSDAGLGMALDSSGDIYVTGYTVSPNFPISQGAFQGALAGSSQRADAFVTKLALGAVGQFSVTGMLPSHGGNNGSVTVTIVGAGFHSGLHAKLQIAEGADIVSEFVTVDNDGRTISAVFDLHGAPLGARDLEVTNSEGSRIIVPGAFTIESGRAPEIHVDVLGRGVLRFFETTTVSVVIGNRGNVDAVGVVTFFTAPSGYDVRPLFPFAPPPSAVGVPVVDWSVAPGVLQVSLPTATGDIALGIAVPVFVPIVPANASVTLQFSVQNTSVVTGGLRLGAWACAPMFGSPPKQDAIDCALAIFGAAISILPGSTCGAFLVTHFVTIATSIVQIARSRTSKDVFFSLLQMQASIINDGVELSRLALITADCTAVATGVGALATSIGKLLKLVAAGEILLACRDVYNGAFVELQTILVNSRDPNALVGPAGVGGAHYVPLSSSLPYGISFENEADATAPAASVRVTAHLSEHLDNGSITATSIVLGDQVIHVPPTLFPVIGGTAATNIVDLRPKVNLLLRIDVSFEAATNTLIWQFDSLDPLTGLPTNDPLLGFLPPGSGGSVLFTAGVNPGLLTGTVIDNFADIVFDRNQTVPTNHWINSVDDTSPISHVRPLPAVVSASGFEVESTSTDVGSGVGTVLLFVSRDQASAELIDHAPGDAVITFVGEVGHTYAFFSLARDRVGNVEAAKTMPDTATTVSVDFAPPVTIDTVLPQPNQTGWNNSDTTLRLVATDNDGGSGVREITYSALGANIVPDTVVAGDAATISLTIEGISIVTYFATDNAGHSEPPHVRVVKIDKTPPRLRFGIPTPQPNTAGWNKTPVEVPFTVADEGSGIEYTDPKLGSVLVISAEGEAVTGVVTATDVAGNSATYTSPSFNIDRTNPALSFGPPAPSANVLGWNNTDVLLPFVVADSLSGVASTSTPTPLLLSTEGSSVKGTVTVTDVAGNAEAFSSPSFNIDKTPPVVSCDITPALLWPPNHRLAPVTASVHVRDPLSGKGPFTLVSANSNEPDNGTGDGDTAGDIQGFVVGTPSLTGSLRSERTGAGSGRVYSLRYRADDLAGNTAFCSAAVTIPRNR
jgi:hypothetical protein